MAGEQAGITVNEPHRYAVPGTEHSDCRITRSQALLSLACSCFTPLPLPYISPSPGQMNLFFLPFPLFCLSFLSFFLAYSCCLLLCFLKHTQRFARGTATPPPEDYEEDDTLVHLGSATQPALGFTRGTATPPPTDYDPLDETDDDHRSDVALMPLAWSAAPGYGDQDDVPMAVPVTDLAPVRRGPQVTTTMGALSPTPEQARPLTFAGGMLPNDFLRLTIPVPITMPARIPGHAAGDQLYGQVIVQLRQAKLAKNYGLARMDPFVRFRLGRFERHSSVCGNGTLLVLSC